MEAKLLYLLKCYRKPWMWHIKRWARLEASNKITALTRKTWGTCLARSSSLGHTDVHIHRTWPRAGKDSSTRLWWTTLIQKTTVSLKAEVTFLLEIRVHHYMTESLPGKLSLSEFATGKVSSKCIEGDLLCLSLTVSKCTQFRHRFLAPRVISRPQNRCRGLLFPTWYKSH